MSCFMAIKHEYRKKVRMSTLQPIQSGQIINGFSLLKNMRTKVVLVVPKMDTQTMSKYPHIKPEYKCIEVTKGDIHTLTIFDNNWNSSSFCFGENCNSPLTLEMFELKTIVLETIHQFGALINFKTMNLPDNIHISYDNDNSRYQADMTVNGFSNRKETIIFSKDIDSPYKVIQELEGYFRVKYKPLIQKGKQRCVSDWTIDV